MTMMLYSNKDQRKIWRPTQNVKNANTAIK